MLHRLFQYVNKHKTLVLYCVFGMLTTLVNYLVYFPLFYLLNFTAVLSNSFAWLAAVLFAFFTNKSIVFGCGDWSFRAVFRELALFTGCRLFTGVLETGFLFLAVDLLNWESVVCKLAISVVIVIVNYISNKVFVFKKK